MTIERDPYIDERLLNDVCQVLADPLRRHVRYALADDGRLSLREPREFAADGGSLDDGVKLHHQHLPLLTAADLVNWNASTGEVTSTDAFHRAQSLFRRVRELDSAGDL